MELGRDMTTLLIRLTEATERSAVANEQLIELATAERIALETEPLPMMCPLCGIVDPKVSNIGGVGKLSEFVLVATCHNCQKPFLAIPANGWQYARDRDELEKLQKGGNNVSA